MNRTQPRTAGITHVNPVVADLVRSLAFHRSALGFVEAASGPSGVTFLCTPGTDDLVGLLQLG